MDNNDWQKRGNDFWDVVQDAVSSGNYQQLNQQVRETIDDTVEGIRNGMQGAKDGFRNGMQEAKEGFRNGMQGTERGHQTDNGEMGNGYRGSMNNTGRNYRNTMRGAGESFRNGVQEIGSEWRQAWMEAGRSTGNYRKSTAPGYQAGTRRKQEEEKQLPAVYMKNPPGQMSGTVMAITGYALTGVFTLSSLSSALVLAVEPSLPAGIITGVMAVAAVGSLGMGIIGSRTRKMIKRFKSYAKQIGNRAYCTIEELSSRCGIDKTDVVKDLKKMIQKKMFLQGHLDQQETCVIVTDDMYRQYLTVQQQAQERQLKQKALEDQKAQLPEECQKILDEGQEYIRYIRKCNDDIPGEEISQKLSRLELIITRIFDEVSKNPSLAGDLRKFMNYYLPTTRKLVDAYRDLDQEPIVSDSISKTKKEIEDTLDTINQAFENLLNSFFEERALDISSDISVLHTMLAQEGLTKKDFDTGK